MTNEKPTGVSVLTNPALNKSTAFSEVERDELKLRGLLPASICSMALQTERVLANLRRKGNDIERYIFLSALQDRNQHLFYRTVIDNIEEIMPLIYTPTVGEACRQFADIFQRPKGFYITANDRDHIRDILDNWPEKDVRVIVVTDGERILGLGDLGANGMGIPVGKLALYCACAGIHPHQCLPVTLDVGTENQELLDNPLYLGLKQSRIKGDGYIELVDEFVEAVQDAYPNVLIQFEDFLTPNAIALLKRYRDNVCCFNDDIQGTASVVLAGLYASTRISGLAFKDLNVMFLGAGSAAAGIGDLVTQALIAEGLTLEQAQEKLWFVDRAGLITKNREKLTPHTAAYAKDQPEMDLIGAIDTAKPNVLIGVTGAPGTFTREVIERMTAINERPAIFALSNPTSRAECSAEQAYEWSNGQAIFASGSPFPPVQLGVNEFYPGQGNNAYIFPGVGLGVVACKANRVTDEMFLAAARSLADCVLDADLERGTLYPPLTQIRDVSLKLAVAVAECAYAQRLVENGEREKPREELENHIVSLMYQPGY